MTGPGRVLTNADHRGVHRDDPVQVVLGIGLGEQDADHTARPTLRGSAR